MFDHYTKLLMSVLLLVPLSFGFLIEDCAHQKTKTGNQTNSEKNKKMSGVKEGLWGGEHISLEVTAQGATVEFDCAHGSINQKIVLDANGQFNVAGTYVQEHGGPVRKDENADTHPAEFRGRIENDTMTLSVTESDTKNSIGAYKLVYGAKPSIMKCK